MIDEKRNAEDFRWSEQIAASIVDELLVAKLIAEDQAEWARQIVGQDIHIQLVSGFRPPNSGVAGHSCEPKRPRPPWEFPWRAVIRAALEENSSRSEMPAEITSRRC